MYRETAKLLLYGSQPEDSILMRLPGATQWTLESWRASRSFFADLVSRFVRLFYREF